MSARRGGRARLARAAPVSVVLALSAAQAALGSVEQFAEARLSFGDGCRGSGTLRAFTADLHPTEKRIAWRPNSTRTIVLTPSDLARTKPLTFELVGSDGAVLWEATVPWTRPPEDGWHIRAWFDCSSGTLREVAAPDTATVATEIPGPRGAVGRGAASSEGGGPVALLALTFAVAALACLRRFGQARR